jgi:hypothetical protein
VEGTLTVRRKLAVSQSRQGENDERRSDHDQAWIQSLGKLRRDSLIYEMDKI